MKRTYIVARSNPRWQDVVRGLADFVTAASERQDVRVVVGDVARTHEQNDKMWAMLTDISEQVEWPVDGKMQYLSAEEWKDLLTSGLTTQQRIAQGIDGGFVLLGRHTSKMTKPQMRELIELIGFFGDRKGVVWGKERAI